MTRPQRESGKFVRVVLPIVVLVAGVGGLMALVAARPEAKKVEQRAHGTLVEVVTATPSRQQVVVDATGTVIPARTMVVMPEVAGRVVWIHDELVSGGRVRAGDRLLRIDARDYQLAVEQQYANVDRAKLELEVERSRKKIAEREWELLGETKPGEESSLALRDPQLRTAKVNVDAAESGLRRAKLSVERTAITAPFNAVVQNESVEKGQLVGPQTPLATLVGTDQFWVQVSISVDYLSWLRVPGVNAGDGEGTEVRVWQDTASGRITRTGRIVRLLGELDPVGRLARLVVEIEHPLEAAGGDDSLPLPLLLGSFVHVEIPGRDVDGVIEIPRHALRQGNEIYVASADDTLVIREVDVAWRRADSVLVSHGLEPGDRVIVSRVPGAVPGMAVRVGDDAKPPGASSPEAGAGSKPVEAAAGGEGE